MKALVVTVYDADYRTGNRSKGAKNIAGQLRSIVSLMTGETKSLIIGAAVLLLGILACTWETGYQEHIIKSISQTFF